MARYIAIVDYANRKFGAYFPDVPGCTDMGRTEEEVIVNAELALSEWAADAKLEHRPIPAPRTYVQLLKSKNLPKLEKKALIATIPLTGTGV